MLKIKKFISFILFLFSFSLLLSFPYFSLFSHITGHKPYNRIAEMDSTAQINPWSPWTTTPWTPWIRRYGHPSSISTITTLSPTCYTLLHREIQLTTLHSLKYIVSCSYLLFHTPYLEAYVCTCYSLMAVQKQCRAVQSWPDGCVMAVQAQPCGSALYLSPCS